MDTHPFSTRHPVYVCLSLLTLYHPTNFSITRSDPPNHVNPTNSNTTNPTISLLAFYAAPPSAPFHMTCHYAEETLLFLFSAEDREGPHTTAAPLFAPRGKRSHWNVAQIFDRICEAQP